MGQVVDLLQGQKVAPSTENGKVPPPRRQSYAQRGKRRDYLTTDEVDRMMKSAGEVGRQRHRDRTLILLTFRHGLRVSELVALRWSDLDLRAARIYVRRIKNGEDSVHPLGGVEIRALRRLRRDQTASNVKGDHVFQSERGGPLTTSSVRKVVARAGERAGLTFPVHPHMLRHATGYKLANDGQDTRAIQLYLGHRNIQNTVRYTRLAAARFKSFWSD